MVIQTGNDFDVDLLVKLGELSLDSLSVLIVIHSDNKG